METKKCAFCAEEILEAATKCKHCGSDVSKAGLIAKGGAALIQAGAGLVLFALALWYLTAK